MMKGPFLFATN